MTIKSYSATNNVAKFQQGGMAPEAAPMPAEAPAQGGMDQQLQQMAGELLDMLMQQIQDPNAVAMILETALQMLSEAVQGPMGGEPQEAQFYRKGGSIKMARCGSKKLKCGGTTKKSKKSKKC